VTEQGYQPREAGWPRARQQPSGTGWQMFGPFDQDESELPPWAGPGAIAPVRAARPVSEAEDDLVAAPPPRPGRRGRSRAETARRRRSRRRVLALLAGLAVAGLAATAWYYLYGTPARQTGPVTITQLLPGEFATAPNACHVLTSAALSSYLAGTPKTLQTFAGRSQSQCSYTVDARPVFRVLDLTIRAYQPYPGFIPGNGSATAYAAYSFARTRALLATPPKHTPQPPAAITPIPGLGTKAFSAVQVFHSGDVTDIVTVLVRYRNVLITASLQAQQSGGFGPVSVGELQSAALGAARTALAKVRATPAVP
jgi:hypothetical protein